MSTSCFGINCVLSKGLKNTLARVQFKLLRSEFSIVGVIDFVMRSTRTKVICTNHLTFLRMNMNSCK